jgi:hypothetical protein
MKWWMLLLLAACQPAQTPAMDAAPTRNCTRTCATCANTCVVPPDTADWQAFCGYPCTVTSDCPDPAARCAALPGQMGRFCVTMTNPKLCEDTTFDPNYHCPSIGDATCASAMILARPFGFTQNRVCATEYAFCPAGCNSSVTPASCN